MPVYFGIHFALLAIPYTYPPNTVQKCISLSISTTFIYGTRIKHCENKFIKLNFLGFLLILYYYNPLKLNVFLYIKMLGLLLCRYYN